MSEETADREREQEFVLSVKTVTWQKDSHSLFDYEYNKSVLQNTQEFPLKFSYYYIYRNNDNSEVFFKKNDKKEYRREGTAQLLGAFCIREANAQHKLEFFNSEEVRTWPSIDKQTGDEKDEEIYLIVRSLKNGKNENKGYKLTAGNIIKLGRVEYLVSSINSTPIMNGLQSKSRFWLNTRRIVVTSLAEQTAAAQPLECKYCMLGQGTDWGEFLCTPCKCSGTCALVHFRCLQKWNQSKVKKEVVGGTVQYNFEKFYCEVCKEEYPRYVEKNGVEYELLPIERPTGPHLMLEGISEKANNMMVLQNIPPDGIKIGRGHECEIRITDISVSRNHARIDKNGDDYIVFDNKSKFGTLIREEKLILDLSRIKQGVQIGRTVITFEKGRRP